MMGRRPLRTVVLGLVAAGFLLPGAAAAQPAPPAGGLELFQSIIDGFLGSAYLWAARLGPRILQLFILLAFIELAWTVYETAFRRDFGPQGVAAIFFRRLLILLILYNVLFFAIPGMGSERGVFHVADSIREVADDTTEGLEGLRPTALVAQIWQLTKAYAEAWGDWFTWHPFSFMTGSAGITMVAYVIGVLMLLVAVVLILITFLYVWVEAVLLATGGLLLLGFAGSRFTVGWAEAYPTALLRNALRFLLLYFLTFVTNGVLVTMADYFANLDVSGLPTEEVAMTFTVMPVLVFLIALVVAASVKSLPQALLSGFNNLSLRPLYGDS